MVDELNNASNFQKDGHCIDLLLGKPLKITLADGIYRICVPTPSTYLRTYTDPHVVPKVCCCCCVRRSCRVDFPNLPTQLEPNSTQNMVLIS